MKKILFDHIPKTGGTSLLEFFRSILSPKQVTPLILHENIVFVAKLAGEFDVLGGHLELCPEYTWPPNLYHVTVLRDPVERFLSHYSYVRESSMATEPFATLARQHDLDEIVRLETAEVRCLVEHFYLRHFLAGLYPSPEVNRRLSSGDVSVSEATAFMLACYQLIGITELMPMVAHVIGFQNSMRLDSVPINLRQTGKKIRLTDLDRGTLARLRRLTEADQELYVAARSHFLNAATELTRIATLVHVPNGGPAAPPQLLPDANATPAALVSAELHCRSAGVNDSAVSGGWCTLSFKLLLAPELRKIRCFLLIRSALRQVAYREHREIELPLDWSGGTIEPSWGFRCSLGAGLYHCDLSLFSDNFMTPAVATDFEDIYQFLVTPPACGNAAGLCNLMPEFSVLMPTLDEQASLGEVILLETALAGPADTLVRLAVRVTNRGSTTWQTQGIHRVNLSYLSVAPDGVETEGIRTPLPRSVSPGESVDLELVVAAPAQTGLHMVRVGVVEERKSWFCLSNTLVPFDVT